MTVVGKLGEWSFESWAPDLPARGHPSLVDAKNCLPVPGGYGQLEDLSAASDALDNPALGAVFVKDESGAVYNFAGDTAKLYSLSGGTFSDVSKGGGYATASGEHWSFAKFGDRIIATNYSDAMQYIDLGSALFADLPGSPPRARHIAVVRDHVMVANLVSGTTVPNRIEWCAYNNTELWGDQPGKQAGGQDIYGRGGAIQALVPGRRIFPGADATLVLENSVFTTTYVGGRLVFRFDEQKTLRGTPAARSVVHNGDTLFYYADDGFQAVTGGQERLIGNRQVDRWFADNVDESNYLSMVGAIDRTRNVVAWIFPRSGATADRVLFYDWALQRWSYAELDIQWIGEFASSGYTLDTLDTVLTSGIDASSISVDSVAYQGGLINIGAFNSSNQICTFSGEPLTAAFETGEVNADDDTVMTHSIRPHVDEGMDVRCRVVYRDDQRNTPDETIQKMVNGNGRAHIRKRARYVRAKTEVLAGFKTAFGASLHGRVMGWR